MSYLHQLNEQRKSVAASIDSIRKEWTGKEGVMPPDVELKLDNALQEFDALAVKIEREAKAEQVSNWANKEVAPVIAQALKESSDKPTVKNLAFTGFLKQLANIRPSEAEVKAMQVDDFQGGGVLTAPEQFVNTVLRNVDNQTFIRQFATVYSTNINGLGVPTLTTDATDASWTGELTSAPLTELAFGKRELKPKQLKRAVLISRYLLENSQVDIESFVQQRIAEAFARPQENAFMTGNGANQPLGVFTASNDGISTSRDTTAASATVLAGDDFVNALFALKPQYMTRATWMIHRDIVKSIRKIKTTNGDYVWQPGGAVGLGLVTGAAGTILDRPYVMTEFAPNTQTSGLYVAAVGDFSYYWIADADFLRIQVLNELYALTDQVGYVAVAATDGAPVLEEAFSRLKMA